MTAQTNLKNSDLYIANIERIKRLRQKEIKAISAEKKRKCEEQKKYCGVTCLECLSK